MNSLYQIRFIRIEPTSWGPQPPWSVHITLSNELAASMPPNPQGGRPYPQLSGLHQHLMERSTHRTYSFFLRDGGLFTEGLIVCVISQLTGISIEHINIDADNAGAIKWKAREVNSSRLVVRP